MSASKRLAPSSIELSVATRKHWTPARAAFSRWVRVAVSRSARRPVVVALCIVGEARSRSLNRRYRGRDKATNVLSFAGSGRGPDRVVRLGELVFCAPLVAREARAQGKSLAAHWAHLTVHGVLHLRGFNHEHEREAARMESMEVQLLDKIGFTDPYA